jgi:hypothetical protein
MMLRKLGKGMTPRFEPQRNPQSLLSRELSARNIDTLRERSDVPRVTPDCDYGICPATLMDSDIHQINYL